MPLTRSRAWIVPLVTAAVLGPLALAPGVESADLRPCAGTRLIPNETNVAAVRRAVACLHNAARVRRGLAPLRVNRGLLRAATRHANAIVAAGCRCHTVPGQPGLEARVRHTGYLRGRHRWRLGENVGWATRQRAAPRAMFASWMRSPRHRDAILGTRFRDIGIGVVRGTPRSRRSRQAATYVVALGWRG